MKTLMARKMPLYELLNVLQEIYDKGADYVDLIVEPTKEKDVLSLIVRNEYINIEYTYPNETLTDEDLNQLI